MELLIGRNIKRLRHERELTQEEVAMHLGISFQAISRWERGEGYPDITMLPVLANYFGVTTDILLGVDAIDAKQRYYDINSAWRKEHELARSKESFESEKAADGHRRNVKCMRTALKEFPNDPAMMQQLSMSLHRLSGLVSDGEEYLRQAVEVEEQIIRYCDDCEVRNATQQNLVYSYEKLGEHEKAIAQAMKLPNIYKARENTLVFFLQGDERREVARSAIAPLMWALSVHMKALAEEENNPAFIAALSKIADAMLEVEDNEYIRRKLKV